MVSIRIVLRILGYYFDFIDQDWMEDPKLLANGEYRNLLKQLVFDQNIYLMLQKIKGQ
jgi:hypothetical protein